MDVFQHCQTWEDTSELKGPAQTETEHGTWRRSRNRSIAQEHSSGIGFFISGHHIEERRFARSVGADQTDDLTFLHPNAAGVERLDTAERFGDIHRFQQGHGCRTSPRVARSSPAAAAASLDACVLVVARLLRLARWEVIRCCT